VTTNPSILFATSALRNLRRNVRRTLAVLLTVACGTGILYVYHGFNTGIMNQYRENAVHAFAGHGVVMPKGYRGQTFERPWEHWFAGAGEVQAKLAAIPGVTQVFPRVTVTGLLTNGRMTVTGRGLGVSGPAEAGFFTALNVEEGHNFTTEPDGILLGKGLARALAAHPGDHVTLMATTVDGTMNAEDFTVTGIFHTGSKFVDDVLFRIPIERAQALLATDRIESFGIGLADTWGWRPVAAAITRDLPAVEPVAFEEIDRLYYQNAVDFLAAQYRVMQLIILAIVVMGILSTITASVLERKQEIGNYRANGESTRDVMRLLLVEAVALGATGGALGVLLALFIVHVAIPHGVLMPPAPGLTRQFYVRVELQSVEGWRAFGIGIVACAIGTALAGWKVNKLSIAEALRST
jgi:putative ABC transport system permease protein